jgi:chromatin segregation and condensation protein Rec8/ScpA/Scc1 (kleisin family)
MSSGSGHNANTSQELVIYEPTTWDLVDALEEVNHPSATVCNPPAWISQLFARLQKVEEDVRLLAEAREEEDVMEIDISDMRSYYKTLSKNASELFWEMTQNQSFESARAEERFKEIVRDCPIFSNEIWTAICG